MTLFFLVIPFHNLTMLQVGIEKLLNSILTYTNGYITFDYIYNLLYLLTCIPKFDLIQCHPLKHV